MLAYNKCRYSFWECHLSRQQRKVGYKTKKVWSRFRLSVRGSDKTHAKITDTILHTRIGIGVEYTWCPNTRRERNHRYPFAFWNCQISNKDKVKTLSLKICPWIRACARVQCKYSKIFDTWYWLSANDGIIQWICFWWATIRHGSDVGFPISFVIENAISKEGIEWPF